MFVHCVFLMIFSDICHVIYENMYMILSMGVLLEDHGGYRMGIKSDPVESTNIIVSRTQYLMFAF